MTTLDLGLDTFGAERGDLWPIILQRCLGGGSHAWRDEQLRGMGRDWVKLHADVLLRLFGNRVQEVDGSNQTWTQQEEPYDELGMDTAKPLGIFYEPYGVWLHYEADADDHDAVDEAGATVLRRGLTDSGLAHLSGLRKLTLSGCQAVSDAGVCAVLLRRCPDLVEISLSERMHRHHRRDAQRPRSKLPAPQQAERLALHPSLRRPRARHMGRSSPLRGVSPSRRAAQHSRASRCSATESWPRTRDWSRVRGSSALRA